MAIVESPGQRYLSDLSVAASRPSADHLCGGMSVPTRDLRYLSYPNSTKTDLFKLCTVSMLSLSPMWLFMKR